MTRTALALLAAVLLAAPAAATAETSPGVAHLATIPEPGIVSGRVRDGVLWVSSMRGVAAYDVRTDPAAPAKLGELALPNGQNEDVDVAGGILLVSDEPNGGRGILHVVDARDPRALRVIGTYRTWRPADPADPFGVRFSVAGRGGLGHTASCLQECRYAWLAGSGGGIEVVDLRDPARPRFAGRFRTPDAGGLGTHDVQVDARGLAWVVGSAGAVAYDVTDPVRPRVVHRTARASAVGPLNDLIFHDSQRRGDVLTVTEETIDTECPGQGSLQTYGVRGRVLRHLDTWQVEEAPTAGVYCTAHYHDVRDGLVAQAWYEAGVRFLDVRDPERIRQVAWHVPASSMFWQALFAPDDPAGEVVYALDHARGIDVLRVARAGLRPRRRVAPRRAGRLTGAGLLLSARSERVRPGQRLGLNLAVYTDSRRVPARDVRVTLALPAGVDALPSRGLTVDPVRREVSFRLPRLARAADRRLRLRVRPDAPAGTIEVVGAAVAAGEGFPTTDRGVARLTVSRRGGGGDGPAGAPRGRAAGAASPYRLFCRLPSGRR